MAFALHLKGHAGLTHGDLEKGCYPYEVDDAHPLFDTNLEMAKQVPGAIRVTGANHLSLIPAHA